MRDEFLDITEITDSREVIIKKSPPAITVFISVVAIILIAAVIWSCFGQIDKYFSASGELRTETPSSVILLKNSGKIKNIFFKDGSIVKSGDVLFELDSGYYEEQRKLLEKQISERKSDIDSYNKLTKSIKTDTNLFDLTKEAKFYYQYKNYELELKTALNQISESNNQIEKAKKEFILNKQQAEAEYQKNSNLYSEYSKMYYDIENDIEYNGSNTLVKTTYYTYKSTLKKAQDSYDIYVESYTTSLELSITNPELADDNQIEKAKLSMENAKAEIELLKISTLSEISNKLYELENHMSTIKANIDNYDLKIKALAIDNSEIITTEKTKSLYYSNINNTISNLNNEIESFNSKISEMDEGIKQSKIFASQNGTLVYSYNLIVGDTIPSGTSIASIVPNTKNYNVVIYIPEQYAADVKIGEKVEYSFAAVSSTDYEKVYGKILAVSEDSFFDQSKNQKYYKATASIDKTNLNGKGDETLILKVGMIAQAHMITGSQSIMSWLLDKLNFKY